MAYEPDDFVPDEPLDGLAHAMPVHPDVLAATSVQRFVPRGTAAERVDYINLRIAEINAQEK